MRGLIIKALSGFYYVLTEVGVVECKARGKFRNDKLSPLVGDNVEITIQDGKGTVDKIYGRKNQLDRPPVANIDKLFIVSSATTPSPNLLLIDRLTAICEFKSIVPIIVFNKTDAGDVSFYSQKYRSVGYKTIECSAILGSGIDEFLNELKNSISAFTGNSGVGKSSLLNVLFPELSLETGEVSEKLGRGRHTTRHTELIAHPFDGFVADTPGFSSLEEDMKSIEFKDALADCFTEFRDFVGLCKFADCKHIGERGCAVCGATDSGEIDKDRYASYLTLYNELKDLKPWNITKKSDAK